MLRRIILFLTLVCGLSECFSYRSPDVYWYWSQGAGEFNNLHTTVARTRPFNDAAAFGGAAAAGVVAGIFTGGIGLGVSMAAAAAAKAAWEADPVNKLYNYYWNCSLMRMKIDSDNLIPLFDGGPVSFANVFAASEDGMTDFSNIENTVNDSSLKGFIINKVKDFEVETQGWGKRYKDARESAREDVRRIKNGLLPASQIYTSLEQGLMIFNHARHYWYSSEEKTALTSSGSAPLAVAQGTKILPKISHPETSSELNGDSLLAYWGYRLSRPGGADTIRKRVADQKFIVRYGDRVKLVSTGSYLTLFSTDQALPENQQVFASHVDTKFEIDKFKNVNSTDPESLSWFYVKGPFRKSAVWNCNVGDVVKKGDIIRLENVASKKNLMIDTANSPVDARLAFAPKLSWADWRYMGAPSIAASNDGSKAYKYANKPSSDEILVRLANDQIGTSTNDLKISFAEDTDSQDLCIGTLVHFESQSDPGYYLWSQHAFFKSALTGEAKDSSVNLGLVSCLKVENKETDLINGAWFVSAVDSLDAKELAEIKMDMIGELSEVLEENLSAYCHTVLRSSNNSYFNGVKVPSGDYPDINTEFLATAFVKSFEKFFKRVPFSFWKNSKFKNASDAVDKLLITLRLKFVDFENVLTLIDAFELNVLSKNPVFKKTSFRDLMLKISKQYALSGGDTNQIAGLKDSLDLMMKSRILLLEKTGFASLEDLLSVAKKPNLTSSSQIGASIFAAWLRTVRGNLEQDQVADAAQIDSWLKTLRATESRIYINDNSFEVGAATINKTISLLTDLLDKDELLSREKQELINSLLIIFGKENYDNMLTANQVENIAQGLAFLGKKFNLENDSEIGVDFKRVLGLVSSAIVFGLEYSLGQFESTLASLENEEVDADAKKLVDSLKTILQTIIEQKAGFDFLEPNSLKNFVETVSKSLKSNKYLVAHDADFKDKSILEQESKFSSLLSVLQEKPTIVDYVNYFTYMAKQAESKATVGQVLSTILSKTVSSKLLASPLKTSLSKEKITKLNVAIEKLLAKKVSGLKAISLSDQELSFNQFLINRKNEVLAMKNNNQGWKTSALFVADPKTKLSFLDFVAAFCSYKEFNPDFTNEYHKFGMISLIKFLEKCFVDFSVKYSDDEVRMARLSNFLQQINSAIKKEEVLKNYLIASNDQLEYKVLGS